MYLDKIGGLESAEIAFHRKQDCCQDENSDSNSKASEPESGCCGFDNNGIGN